MKPKRSKTKPTAGVRKARQIAATGNPEHPPPGLTREQVKGLTEPEKNVLRAEALALLTKGQAATGTAALALSEPDAARLRELMRCGMLPSDPPPHKLITPQRGRELRALLRKRQAADREGKACPVWLDATEEAYWDALQIEAERKASAMMIARKSEQRKIAEAEKRTAEKALRIMQKNETTGAATLAARVEFLLRLTEIDGKATANDKLLKAYAGQRKAMPEGTTKIDVCRDLARTEYQAARRNPKACPWLCSDKANAVHKAVVGEGNPFTEADIEQHAKTLKRRLDRAIETHSPKAKRAKP